MGRDKILDYLFLLEVSTIVDPPWIRWHVLIFPSLGVRGIRDVSMLPLRVPGSIHCHVCGAEQLFLAWAKFIHSVTFFSFHVTNKK